MKKTIIYLLALVVVLTLAACGKKEEAAPASSNSTASSQLKITATNWKFDQAEYKVKKGETVKVSLDSKEGAHAIKVNGVEIGASKSKDITFDKAGTYDIECTIPCGSGHATMKSKLIVE